MAGTIRHRKGNLPPLFTRRDHTYGIFNGRTWQFESAAEIKALRRRKGGFHPPQSYRHLGNEEFVKLMDCSSSLKSIRRTLPCEDTLLAAQCLAKGHTLVTDHAKHFQLLRPLGLVVENPLVWLACKAADHFPHSRPQFTFCESENSYPILR